MQLPLIVGQAPARSGDGTPFSGSSGKRLCKLAGVETLEELKQYFRLDNLITHEMAQHHSGKGDAWDPRLGSLRARQILAKADPGDTIIACGKNVWKAFDGWWDTPYFNSSSIMTPRGYSGFVKVYLFPHPSGVSHFWNTPSNVDRAERFLKRVGGLDKSSRERALPAHSESPSEIADRASG